MGYTEEMKKALKGSGAGVSAGLLNLWVPPDTVPAFATIENWCRISGMGRRVTYDEIGRGNLRAIKMGARTLIDVPHGLAYLRSRPAAKIRAPRERNAQVSA